MPTALMMSGAEAPRVAEVCGSGRQRTLLPKPGTGVIESLAASREQVADLRLIDDQRRAERQRVAERARDQSMLLRALHGERTDGEFGVERLPRFLVLHHLDAAYEADAAHLAHERMIGELAQAGLKGRRHSADLGQNVAFLVDLQRFDRDCGAHGVAAV